MILPGLAFCPSESFTPRYFGRESLPNFVAPVALVFAMLVSSMLQKIKQFVKENLADIMLVIGVILISLLSFAAGYIIAKQQKKEPIRFEETTNEISKSGHCWGGDNRTLFSLETL
jgi:hypothetical protein